MTQNPNAIQTIAAVLPSPSEWSLMTDMAKALVPTGFLPESIKRPEQAVAIMLKGRELRVPPMYALSNIAIVKGKPTVSAEMMLALIYRDHGQQALRIKDSDNTHCTIEYRVAGWSGTSEYTFTIDDAKRAGLVTNGGTWDKYPAALCRARCISAVGRMAFPDTIAGMYVPGELGDEITVTDDGEVMAATARVIDEPTNIREVAPPVDDHERAMRFLHASAKYAGVTHEQLHAHAVSMGFSSLSEVPTERLRTLADRAKGYPEHFNDEMKRYLEAAPDADAETGEIIDVAPAATVTDDIRAVKKELWAYAHDVCGWTKEQLETYCLYELDTPLGEAPESELKRLHQIMLSISKEELEIVLGTAYAAVA